MARTALPIPLGFYQALSPTLSIQRCINWIPSVMEKGALNATALLQPSGISLTNQTGLGICRGSADVAGVAFFVMGQSLVSMAENGATTNHGAVSGSARVSMADNGLVLVIVVPGGEAFTYTLSTSTLEKITDVDFQTSDTVGFIRGFFVFTASDGKQFFVSNLNQPLVFSGLDFGSAEGDPDRIVTQVIDHDELKIIGEKTTEVFGLLTGTAGFPFQIIPGAFTQKGGHSKYGVVKFDNTYLFIGGGENELSAIWRQTSSASAVKISTDAIDHEIQKFTKAEIAESFITTFSKNGQFFAIFTFNSTRIPSRTFAYNGTASGLSGSSVWFEFQTGLEDNSWRVNSIVKAYGKLFVGDALDGRVGQLVENVYTEYGNTVTRTATTQPFSANDEAIFAGELEVTMQAGVGLSNGQGSKPVIMMEFTDNNQTFPSGRVFKREIGAIGEYGHETVWNRQGRFPKFRSYRFTVNDPVNANLIRMAATAEAGN